jgi:O-antigen/teichoic acid export membrane protein
MEETNLNLAQKTVRGMIWAYAAYFGGRLINLITTALLAHFLLPEDFGLIGSALIVITFIEAIRSFGVNEALIYNDTRVDDAADTVFLLNVGFGILQFVLAFIFAPLAVLLFHEPRIVDLIRLVSVSFIFNALGQTHDALMQKELKFRKRFLPEVISSAAKGVVSIGMVYLGFGVWAIAIGYVVNAAVITVVLWLMVRWRPRFRFFTDKARELWRYGVNILMLNALAIAVNQANPIIIGSMLGATQLGYLTVAARIPELIVMNFTNVLTKVLFPTYVKIKNDREMLLKGLFTTTKYISFVTMALGFGMAAVAPEVVRLVFPSGKWEPAIPLFMILAINGMISTLAWNAGDVFKAIGRPDVSTKLLVIETAYTFFLIWAMASNSGLAIMASLGNTLALSLSVFLRLALIGRFLKFNPLVFFNIFKAPLLAGISMFAAVTLWRGVVGDLPMLVVLSSSILIGAFVYLAIIWLLQREDFAMAREMIFSLVRRRSDPTLQPANPEV